MTNNEMVLELLEVFGPDPKRNDILRGVIKELLKEEVSAQRQQGPEDVAVQEKTDAVERLPETDTEQEPAAPKKRGGGRKEIDMGKCRALLKAGWSIAKCADELGVSEPTLRKRLKEEGLLK